MVVAAGGWADGWGGGGVCGTVAGPYRNASMIPSVSGMAVRVSWQHRRQGRGTPPEAWAR